MSADYFLPIQVPNGFLLTLVANEAAVLTIGDGGTLAGMAYQSPDSVAITGGVVALTGSLTLGPVSQTGYQDSYAVVLKAWQNGSLLPFTIRQDASSLSGGTQILGFFDYSGTRQMSIDSGGKLSVGSSVEMNATVSSPNAELKFNKYTTSNFGTLSFQTTTPSLGRQYLISHFSDNTLRITHDGPNDDLVINSSGNVGVGTSNPTAKLYVAGTFTVSGDLTLVAGSRMKTTSGGFVFEPADGFTYFDPNTKVAAIASGGFSVATDRGYGFTASNVAWDTVNVRLMWNASGKIEVNNGTTGSYRDLILRNLEATGVTKLGTYTIATLPDASTNVGCYVDVSDAAVGPGLARSNGTAWKIPNTNTTII